MEKRQLGNSTLHVSTIGLGCMSLCPDKKESRYIIDEALEMGINYVDTADLYDYGKNEALIGEVIKKNEMT